MKTLVTGANGMLGTALCPALTNNAYRVLPTDINATDSGVEYLDIRDSAALRKFVGERRPDMIFHLAAETDVDKCEQEPEHAYLTNTTGTENIARLCKEFNIPLIYISTCGVFDGKKKEPYNELDEPHPISVYTKSKFKGEEIVKRLLKDYFIFRAGWMIGGGRRDKKFVAKIVELLKTKDTLTVVNDKRGCPTFTKDFSECIIKIIKTSKYGLYHVTNGGSATRFDIASKIVEFLGRNDVVVEPISSDAFPLPAHRPDSEVVDNHKLNQLGFKMPPWEEGLREYLKELVEEK